MQVDVAGAAEERIERSLTLLVRRAQKVHLHADTAGQPVERAAYAILGVLFDEGPVRAVELAGRFHLDASTVSRQVAALVEAGLIGREPDPDDGRASRLRLTERGHDALQATRVARRRILHDLLSSWTPQQQEMFAELLERFNAGLDARLAAGMTPAAR